MVLGSLRQMCGELCGGDWWQGAERPKLSEGETVSDESKRDAGEPFAEAHGSAAVIVAKGYYRLKAENERLREWIRNEGVRTDACTYDVLGEICEGCRCKRYYAKQGYGKPPNAEVSESARKSPAS